MKKVDKIVMCPNVGLRSEMPLRLRSIGHRTVQKGSLGIPSYVAHFIMFIWISEGSGTGLLDGSEVVFGNNSLITVLPGGSCESFKYLEDTEYWWISIDGPMIMSLVNELDIWNGVFNIHKVPASRMEMLMEYAEQETHADAMRSIANACGIMMQSVSERDSCAKDKLIHQAMKIIMTEWRNPELNVNNIARRLQVHRSTLSSRFRDSEGCSVLDKIHSRRLEEVAKSLRISSAMVKEIANDCGFSDANYMIRLFKRRFGCTPKEFRTNYFA